MKLRLARKLWTPYNVAHRRATTMRKAGKRILKWCASWHKRHPEFVRRPWFIDK